MAWAPRSQQRAAPLVFLAAFTKEVPASSPAEEALAVLLGEDEEATSSRGPRLPPRQLLPRPLLQALQSVEESKKEKAVALAKA